jgi:hypothetical protein
LCGEDKKGLSQQKIINRKNNRRYRSDKTGGKCDGIYKRINPERYDAICA